MKKWLLLSLSLSVLGFYMSGVLSAFSQEDIAWRIQQTEKQIRDEEAALITLRNKYTAIIKTKQEILQRRLKQETKNKEAAQEQIRSQELLKEKIEREKQAQELKQKTLQERHDTKEKSLKKKEQKKKEKRLKVINQQLDSYLKK